jgi:hypothetical protein
MNPEDLEVILDRFSLTEGGPGTALCVGRDLRIPNWGRVRRALH